MKNYSVDVRQSRTAAEVMSAPSGIVRTGTTVWEVVERFLTGPARHVVVVDGDGHCAGILAPRHLAGLWPLDPKQLKATPVESLGYAGWITLRPDDDLRTCARMLTEHHLDAVPVLNAADRVVGVVTARDVTRAVADAPERGYQSWEE